MAMLANGTHYEQVSLQTLKKILDRKVILSEEMEEEAAAQPGDRKGNPSSANAAGKES
ncbi:MAG: hypothetical protein WA369_03995 [Candidatus Acidiferrales bacterium]